MLKSKQIEDVELAIAMIQNLNIVDFQFRGAMHEQIGLAVYSYVESQHASPERITAVYEALRNLLSNHAMSFDKFGTKYLTRRAMLIMAGHIKPMRG